jgi:hypothetical protein
MASRCSRNTASLDSPFPAETLIILSDLLIKNGSQRTAFLGISMCGGNTEVGRFGCEKPPASVNDRQQGKPAIIFHLNVANKHGRLFSFAHLQRKEPPAFASGSGLSPASVMRPASYAL